MDDTDTKAERTRRRILDAAAHEFAVHGYGGASLRRIAAAAELKVGSLYFHFKTKDDLVGAALADGVESARLQLVAGLRAVPADATPQQRLRAAIRSHLDALHASDDRATAVVRMVDTLPPNLRAAHSTSERRFGRVWLDILRKGQIDGSVRPDVNARVLRDIVVGALNSTSSANPNTLKDLAQFADTLATLVAPPPAAIPSGRR
ncbi:TetR family transcriptional regulator [Antrihabitans stalactiti]|uniref:TetR/AcrR family transcriptional regulator n=1 Tax=Antrihabitans stalactiti TaxID=2584121 RepID=A0A848KD54_9NOCA|nr:TetR/AcrR family transcriptional regulator [Antrihabitans stalactiti]